MNIHALSLKLLHCDEGSEVMPSKQSILAKAKKKWITSSRSLRSPHLNDFAILCCLLLTACAVGPDYKAPDLNLPKDWHSGKDGDVQTTNDAKAAQTIKIKWWEAFHDDVMSNLITRALDNNENRKVAKARVLEARANRQSSIGNLFPHISAGVEGRKSDLTPGQSEGTTSLFQSNFDASYELDLFGGNRRQAQADKATMAAREADYRNISLTLTAEVAREYINMRQLQHQLELTKHTAESQKKLKDITTHQFKGGVIGKLDVSQAEVLYKDTQAKIPEIERQLQAGGYRLSILLGENPGVINNEIGDKVVALPVPDKIEAIESPTEIIRQRPDIQRSESELIAATALSGVAISQMYPKISLSALLGIQDSHISSGGISTNGGIWSVGSSLTMPLLNFGKVRGLTKAAQARQEQALHKYKQTVLDALGEVETSLSNINKENQRRLKLQDAAKSADKAVEISNELYKKGLSDFTSVIQTEEQSFSIKNDLVASEANIINYIVALNKSLGRDVETKVEKTN